MGSVWHLVFIYCTARRTPCTRCLFELELGGSGARGRGALLDALEQLFRVAGDGHVDDSGVVERGGNDFGAVPSRCGAHFESLHGVRGDLAGHDRVQKVPQVVESVADMRLAEVSRLSGLHGRAFEFAKLPLGPGEALGIKEDATIVVYATRVTAYVLGRGLVDKQKLDVNFGDLGSGGRDGGGGTIEPVGLEQTAVRREKA